MVKVSGNQMSEFEDTSTCINELNLEGTAFDSLEFTSSFAAFINYV